MPGSISSTSRTFSAAVQLRRRGTAVMTSTRFEELVMDTLYASLDKWKSVSGPFGGSLTGGFTPVDLADLHRQSFGRLENCRNGRCDHVVAVVSDSRLILVAIDVLPFCR